MEEFTYRELIRFRNALRTLKKSGACESSFRLQHAVDKNLRKLTEEYGNSNAHKLEDFERDRKNILEFYAQEDEEGRPMRQHRPTGAVVVLGEDNWLYAKRHESGDDIYEKGDVWEAGPEQVRFLDFIFPDEEEQRERSDKDQTKNEAIDELLEETSKMDVHQVPATEMDNIDLEKEVSNRRGQEMPVGRQVDTSVLDIMIKD